MPTTQNYLTDLVNQKNALSDNLNAVGVSASRSEKLNTLVPKVLETDTVLFEDDYYSTYRFVEGTVDKPISELYIKPGETVTDPKLTFRGKNLLRPPVKYENAETLTGIKITVNPDNSVTLSADSYPHTVPATNSYYNLFYCVVLGTDDSYFHFNHGASINSYLYISGRCANNDGVSNDKYVGIYTDDGKSFTVPSSYKLKEIYIQTLKGFVLEKETTLYPMLETGSCESGYEPFISPRSVTLTGTFQANTETKIEADINTFKEDTYMQCSVPFKCKMYMDKVSAGKRKEWSDFWDKYQGIDTGAASNGLWQPFAYSGAKMRDVNYNPKHAVFDAGSDKLFYLTQISDTKVPIKFFGNCSSAFASENGMSLVTVREIDLTDYPDDATFENWFLYCYALKNITFKGEIKQDINLKWSPLSSASVKNITEHLCDMSSTEETRTLSLSTSSKNTLTDELKAMATAKGWTIA